MQRVTNRWKKSCRAPEAAWNTCASDAWHVVFVGAARRSWVEALSLRRCKAWLAAGRCLRTLAGVVRAFGLVLVREDDRTPATDWPRLGGGHLQQIPSPPARAHLRELFSIPPRSDTFMRMTSQLTYAANVNHLHSFFFFVTTTRDIWAYKVCRAIKNSSNILMWFCSRSSTQNSSYYYNLEKFKCTFVPSSTMFTNLFYQ